MATGWSIFIGLFIVGVMCAVAWFFSPKGENQVCYLMWAITFLAQLNPLIVPRRSDLRKEFLHH
ncbi:hypothetical protein RB597_002600 [Gaeumannomyces tritici]